MCVGVWVRVCVWVWVGGCVGEREGGGVCVCVSVSMHATSCV